MESFGLAALEAMACEVPVVASNVGGVPEVIEHGVDGYLHEPRDVKAAADMHSRSCPGRTRPRHGTNSAHQCPEKDIAPMNVIPLYEEYYRQVIGTVAATHA